MVVPFPIHSEKSFSILITSTMFYNHTNYETASSNTKTLASPPPPPPLCHSLAQGEPIQQAVKERTQKIETAFPDLINGNDAGG